MSLQETLSYGIGTLTNGIATLGSATVSKPVAFVTSFFSNTNVISAIKAEAFQKRGDQIFQYLSLQEVLNVTACSRFTSSVHISQSTAQNFLSRSRVSHLGKVALNLSLPMTCGNFRRILFCVVKSSEGTLRIDASSGRVILDLGSAFKDQRAFAESNAVIMVHSPEGEEDSEPILKHLEVSSYDEYDDFNPRHPNPRDMSKTHRRGDSYFNSDIESIAKEALADVLNLSAIASQAAALEELQAGKPKASGRTSRVQSKLGIAPMMSEAAKRDGHGSSDEEDDSKPDNNF